MSHFIIKVLCGTCLGGFVHYIHVFRVIEKCSVCLNVHALFIFVDIFIKHLANFFEISFFLCTQAGISIASCQDCN